MGENGSTNPMVCNKREFLEKLNAMVLQCTE